MNIDRDEYDDLRLKLLSFLEDLGPEKGPSMIALFGATYISSMKSSGQSKEQAMEKINEFANLIYDMETPEAE